MPRKLKEKFGKNLFEFLPDMEYNKDSRSKETVILRKGTVV